MMKKFLTICLLMGIKSLSAQTVFNFDFSGYTGSAPPLFASAGSATLTQNGLSNFAEDACTGQGFSVNSWNTNDYLQIKSSTSGFIGPFTFSFDYRMSDADLGNFEIQVSTDGVGFNKLGDLNASAPTPSCNGWGPISLGSFYNNQPNIYFRFLKKNDAVTALNRLRLDNISLKASAVPVEISYFSAQAVDNQKVTLKWETASEINSHIFIVERSRNAVHYEQITQLPAAGFSRSPKTYYFTDESALFGTNYYRLRQIDQDGTQQVFRPQTVTIEDLDVPFGVFPNPVNTHIFMVKTEDSDEANVTLKDIENHIVATKVQKISQTIMEITTSNLLQSGIYFLEVQTLGNTKIHKIMVVR